ncbi:T6SS immunity protein Tli4 family protein [Caballeronia sordidicola]|uniref:T6SS immunity protein Tli4 family protein n=1 Tax=Caballeronia sordidicola TaxID=196367 RepID=UPI0004D00B26|nr:T6SS immunity protein Tli4 family protein [Caballeronia sordidicola]
MNVEKIDLAARCIGRFVVNAPRDALTFGRAKVQGVSLDAKQMSREDFVRDMQATEAKLTNTKSVFGYKYLYEHGVGPTTNTRYFIHLKTPNESSDSSRTIDAYKWADGYRLKLSITGSDFTESIYKNTPSVMNLDVKNDVPQKSRVVFDLLGRIRGRDDNVIPTEPGMCFLGGFLAGKAQIDENVSSQFILKAATDVSFGVETNSGIRETTTLLQRGDQIAGMLKNAEGGRTIRSGPLSLPEIQAEEWLMAGLSPLSVQGTFFMLEANSTTSSAQTPLVGVEMHNGWPAPDGLPKQKLEKASLTEDKSIALWDAVSRTLRPRPNGF